MPTKKKRLKKVVEKGKCRFTKARVYEIDYKDLATLQKMVSAQGKIYGRKRTGTASRFQRKLKDAIKRARYLALRPTLAEYVLEMPRGAQIIYPKDLATIALFADIGPGQTVIEAGVGSGALTLVLLRLVGPTGRVVSYETREEFARRAQRNIEARLGPGVALTVRPQDIYLGIEEREVDRVVLDLPEPWRLVEPAARALRAGGIFCAYVPTIPQSQRVHEALLAHPAFALVETFETLLRPWNIAGPSVRPAHRMVAHTGFLTLARRIQPAAGGSPESTPSDAPGEDVDPADDPGPEVA
jgi:tRNA (adenine57-N1/adenine58-N1)-methyltransferase